MTSLLQSEEWLGFQQSLGRKVLRYDIAGLKTAVIVHPLRFGKSYLYVPYGPAIEFDTLIGGIKNNLSAFASWLKHEGKKEKAIFAKVEPLEDKVAEVLVPAGFKKSKRDIQPHKTVIIDLTQSEDDLLSKLHHKTRYNIRLAQRENVVIEKGGDIEEFLKLLKKTTERDAFTSHPEEYYKKFLDYFSRDRQILTDLWFARKDGRAIAATITLTYLDTIYYLHSASDHDFRELKAPNLLRWTILESSKRLGLARADFWGIDAKKWPGVTAYKLGWGGRTIEYPGAFDLVISKPWKLAYDLVQKLQM